MYWRRFRGFPVSDGGGSVSYSGFWGEALAHLYAETQGGTKAHAVWVWDFLEGASAWQLRPLTYIAAIVLFTLDERVFTLQCAAAGNFLSLEVGGGECVGCVCVSSGGNHISGFVWLAVKSSYWLLSRTLSLILLSDRGQVLSPSH